jgi:hypothetical protein
MHHASKWIAALTLVGASGAALGQTVYTVNFMADSEKITGYIDLAAKSLGPITPSEITGWALSSVAGDPVAFSFKSSDADSVVSCSGAPGCGLTASASSLSFISGVSADIFFGDPAGTIAISTPAAAQSGNFPAVLLNTAAGPAGFAKITGNTIATAKATTSAPEIDPASAAGGLGLLLGSLMVLRGRHRAPL